MEQNVRPDFYEGQYLGAEDLDAVVDYDRVQRARHAMGANTWGIGAGLELRERKLPSGDVDVSILPGVAWDGYGRTILVLAPVRVSPDQFVNFQADTPAAGQLIKVWVRYAETASKPPAPGFEMCRPDGTFSRVVETFAIEVGEPAEPPHGSVVVGGRSVDPLKSRAAFLPGAPDLFDESVGFQSFPPGGNRPTWLVPIGYVRWLKTGGQPGRLIARNDTGAGGVAPDSDLIRAFRRYIGAVAESINAADGLIRLRDRSKDPDPGVSHVKLPRVATDPAKPPENDLVWVEGHLHVLGDVRVSGGKAEFRNNAGDSDGVPLAIRRVEPNALGGKDLQIVLGAESMPAGAHVLAIGPGSFDATTGQLKPAISKRLVVRDDGTVGVGIDAPPQLLTLGGEGNTRLEIGRVTTALPWGTNTPANIGAFVINQQSHGSSQAGADFGLMRDRKLRLALGDRSTFISSQDGDVVVSVNFNEPGDTEVMRATQAAKVGVGTSSPVAKLHVGEDLALNQMASGGPRPLPSGATLIWNDGEWLRLNQNLDHTKPIKGVHTPGVFAPMSLNVGGVSSWGDPGSGNAWISGKLAINAASKPDELHVEGSARLTSTLHVEADAIIDDDLDVGDDLHVGDNLDVGDDVHVGGNVQIDGNLNTSGGSKNFVIAHPLAPGSQRLVHACIEGPEAAVYYRGEGRLSGGTSVIALPPYFEALTRSDARTVLLTPIVEGDEPASALAATRIVNGQFSVRAVTPGNPSQRFCWEAKAIRADIPNLVVELDATPARDEQPAGAGHRR